MFVKARQEMTESKGNFTGSTVEINDESPFGRTTRMISIDVQTEGHKTKAEHKSKLKVID